MRRANHWFVASALAALVIPSTASAAPFKAWDNAYGGDLVESFASVIPTADGGHLLAGTSDSFVSGTKTVASKGMADFYVVKIAADGTQQWDRVYGGTGWDELHVAIATSDGGYLLGGTSNSPIGGDKTSAAFNNSFDMWLVKIDGTGVKQWDKTYGGTSSDGARDLVITPGYIYAAGWSYSGANGNKLAAGKGSEDFWVVKMYSNGIKQWDRSFGAAGLDMIAGAEATSTGGLLLTGTSFSGVGGDKAAPNRGACDYWLVSMDASGNKQWDQTYGGTGEDYGADALRTSTGYIVLGNSESLAGGNKGIGSFGSHDFWVLKIDGTGNKLAERIYGGDLAELAARLLMVPTSQGTRYWLGGTSYSDASGSKQSVAKGMTDGWIVEIDGNTLGQQWDISLGGDGEDRLHDLARTTGDVLAGLDSTSGATGDKTDPIASSWSDFWAVRLH